MRFERQLSKVTVILGAIVGAFLLVGALPGCGAVSGHKRLPPGQAWTMPDHIPVRGDRRAPVSMVMFCDMQTAYCRKVHAALQDVHKAYPDQVNLAVVLIPFRPMYGSFSLSMAALAAHRQGMFWEFWDAVLSDKGRTSEDGFVKHARQVGLDLERLQRDRADPRLQRQLRSQGIIARAVGVRGIPTIFINGRKYGGSAHFPVFKKRIDQALAVVQKAEARKLMGRQKLAFTWGLRQRPPTAALVRYLIDGKAPARPLRSPRRPSKPVGWAASQRWNVPVLEKTDFIRGNSAKSQVTIVEFSDLQCPFCSRLSNTLTKVLDTWPDRVRIVWKHRPLAFHRDAVTAHHAAIAAGMQGKFWEFHDMCFKGGTRALKENHLQTYATELSLDLERFDTDRRAIVVKGRMQADATLGDQLDVRGVPAMFINGLRLAGAQPFNVVKKVIEAELNSAGSKAGPAAYAALVKGGRDGRKELGKFPGIRSLGVPVFRHSEARQLVVLADPTKVDEFNVLHTAYWVAAQRGAQFGVTLVPLAGQTAVSRAIGRLFLAAAAHGPQTPEKLMGQLLVMGPLRSEGQVASLAAQVGMKWDKVQSQQAQLDDQLDAIQQTVTGSNLPGLPVVLSNDTLLQPVRYYSVSFLSRYEKAHLRDKPAK